MVKANRTRGVLALVVLLCLLSFASLALAQKATLTGKVTDSEAGEALPGANVLVSNAEVQTGAATKASGEFTVKHLPPGTYTVTASYIGYETKVVENVEVSAGQTKNIDIVLALTGIEINPIAVTASRRAEKTLDAPASISVIEPREIAQSVSTSSSAILRNVTGVDMSQTGVDRREIVMRGFNNAFSGEAYVLTDNRQSAVASLGVNIHSIMPNMNVDLDKVEIVRGPGAALYGAGVDEGVIHYITKDPFTHPGTTFSFSGGERSAFAGQFRHAAVVNGKVGYKITGQYAQADDWKLNPNDPLDLEQLQADAQDENGNPLNPRNYDYKKFNVNGLLKYRISENTSITLNGGYSQLDAIVLSGIGTLQADGFGYAYGQLRFQSGRFFAQTYLNKNRVGDSFVYGRPRDLEDNSTLFNVQAQYDLEMADGKQQFIFGFDYDRTTAITEGTINGRFEDSDLISETGGYVQSQTALSPQFDLTLALRGDYNNLQEDFFLSPRVAMVFKPTPQHSFRATYNRAFTSPGDTENFLDIPAGVVEGTDITVTGLGSSAGWKFSRNAQFGAIAGNDLVAYSLNPATLGAPQPVGLPLDATYASIFAGLQSTPISVLRAALPPPLNALPDAQLQGLVALFDPQLTEVTGFSRGTLGIVNPITRETKFVQDVTDIKALDINTTDSFELGYKGLIEDKVLFAVDAYYTRKEDFVGPLLMETPFVFVPSLVPELTAALTDGITNNAQLAGTLAGAGFTPEQVAALIVQLAGQLQPGTPLADATVPVAIATFEENAPQLGETPGLALAYRNFGQVDYWGIDASLQVLATSRLSLFGNVSIVSDDFFDAGELNEANEDLALALNAPKFKTKFGFSYGVPLGVSFNAAGRYVEGFPVESGPYVGSVDNYFLLDVGFGYDLGRFAAGMRFDVSIENILDDEHREFIGAPELGRFAMARLSYTLR